MSTKRKATEKPSAPTLDGRILSARRDPIDFRDKNRIANQSAIWILSPNSETQTLKASKSTSHGGVGDDKATVNGTLARIIGSPISNLTPVEFAASASSSRDRRVDLKTTLA